MKIFCDFHHGALARSMLYTFGDRLGHELCFPDSLCAQQCRATSDGTWGTISAEGFLNNGVPDSLCRSACRFVSYEEFCDESWDAYILTRPESQRIFKAQGHPKKGKLYIGVSGNEGTQYEWHWIHNFLATDIMSYDMCPDGVNKIHTLQELGRQYDAGHYVPITDETLHNVHNFLNKIKGYDADISVRSHPGGVNIFKIWNEMQLSLPAYRLTTHGHQNECVNGVCVKEADLPPYYYNCSCVWHYKTADGYGHALLQSLPAGRPVIVPRGFHDDRTAGKYLIEGETAFKCGYDAAEIVTTIKNITSSVDNANEIGERCYNAYKRLFDWHSEAQRVKEWLERAA